MRNFLGFLWDLFLGWLVFFSVILLCGWLLQGCGQQDEPSYFSEQGLVVYDPLGLSSEQDVSLMVQCFEDWVMPDYKYGTDYTQLHLRLIAGDDVGECRGGANVAGCTYRGDYAYVRWLGDFNENAGLHELLHMADWGNECGHVCGKAAFAKCPRWERIYDAQRCYLLGKPVVFHAE